MEQHPVPQNVTTFQFRLIGDMTIKQFGYLAGGAILAYISYKLPIPFFFSWPLTFIFAVGGVGFAFVPIEERPMEIWVMSFIKNIYSPTQFVWSHEEVAPPKVAAPPTGKATADVLQRIYAPAATPGVTHTTQSVARQKTNPFDWVFTLFTPKPKSTTMTTPADTLPTPSITGRHLDLSTPPRVTTQPPVAAEPHHSRMLDLQKQLTSVLTERDQMKKEMASMRNAPSVPAPTPVPAPISTPVPTPTRVPATASRATTIATPQTTFPQQAKPTVNIITPEGAIKAGLPRLTTFPNVVTGITRDSDHNLLPGVLVTVRDADGVPVRALKTNRLGQFAASTPITNGTYLVEIEDPRGRYTFDRAQVTLNGSIVPALEIIAKSQKEVAREKLAKEIFGT